MYGRIRYRSNSISFYPWKVCDTPPRCVAAELGSVRVLREPPPPRTAGGGQRAGSIANVARSKDPDSN